jgi:hypothetical protein
VALGFVAVCALVVLGLIWRVGVRVEHELAAFGSALPAPTQLAMESRFVLSVFVGAVLLVAVLIHRHRQAVLFLVLIGLLELAVGAAYGFALWLPYRAPRGVIR